MDITTAMSVLDCTRTELLELAAQHRLHATTTQDGTVDITIPADFRPAWNIVCQWSDRHQKGHDHD